MIKNLIKELFLFGVGGAVYCFMEIIWRGYSHWSMYFCGGLCFILIGLINNTFTFEMPLWKQMLISSVLVTALEFVFGVVFNIILKMDVWDYSDLPFNLFGQICIPFMFFWFFLSFIGIFLDDWIRYLLFDEEKPHYKIL